MGQITDVIDTSTHNRVGALSPSQDLLEVDFSNGMVTRTGDQFGIGRLTNSAAQPPRLNLDNSSNGLAMSWPAGAGDYKVWFAANLAGSAVWLAVTNAVSFTNGHNSLTISNNGPRGFYRLKTP